MTFSNNNNNNTIKNLYVKKSSNLIDYYQKKGILLIIKKHVVSFINEMYCCSLQKKNIYVENNLQVSTYNTYHLGEDIISQLFSK